MNNTPSIIYVEWVDSVRHGSSWTDIDNIKTSEISLDHHTAGFLLKETEYSYLVAQNKGADLAEMSNVLFVIEIPKSAVRLIRVLDSSEPAILKSILP